MKKKLAQLADRVGEGGVPILFFFALTLYATTLAPGILGGDAGELQFASAVLALPHPSGYPIQIVLDRLFLLLFPLGSVAWRLNLFSALATAGAVALIGHVAALTSGSPWAGFAIGAGLAATPVLWSQAILADKYALNGLLTALILVISSRFYRTPTTTSLVLLALVTGTALAHHRSLILLIPAIFGLVLLRGQSLLRNPTCLLWAALAACTPFLAYTYLPWAAARGLPPSYLHSLTWPDFLRYVFVHGSSGQVQVQPDGPGLRLYLSMLDNAFPSGWLLWLLGGMVLGWRRRPAHRGWQIFLVSSFILTAYLSAVYENYDLPRRYVYFVPSYICLGGLAGEGLAGYLAWTPLDRGKDLRWRHWLHILWLGLALFPLAQLPQQWTTFRSEQQFEQPLDIWRQSLKTGGMAERLAAGMGLVQPGAFVVADWEQATPLWYAQLIQGHCPDCTITQELNNLAVVTAQAHRAGRPLYVARTVNGAEEWSYPNAHGPLVWLAQEPVLSLPAEMTPLAIVFGNQLRLAGYAWPLGQPTWRAGSVLPISLIWQRIGAETLPPYAISLRLYANDQEVWKADNPSPVLGMHPFSVFTPNEVVTDYYEIPLDADWPSGTYSLHILLYEVSTENGFTNAQAVDSTNNWLGEEMEILHFQRR